MKVVLKIGGAALEDKATLRLCARAIADLREEHHQVAVVHGGGAALTRTLKSLGKQSVFVNGLRVTDADTRDAALMVLSGLVNKNLVAAISATGHAAVGLCAGDGLAFRAQKKVTPDCDLGFVGEITSADPRWIHTIWDNDGVPVVASLALGHDGEYYNVNADQMAAACAVACEADALIFLTDVPGVKDADGSVMQWLHLAEIPGLVRDSIIAGGMLPKLEACAQALHLGVGRVRIMPAQLADVLPKFCNSELQGGTEVVVA